MGKRKGYLFDRIAKNVLKVKNITTFDQRYPRVPLPHSLCELLPLTVCVCVCVYIYIYIYMYVRTYVCMYVYLYVCVYECMYVCMYGCDAFIAVLLPVPKSLRTLRRAGRLRSPSEHV